MGVALLVPSHKILLVTVGGCYTRLHPLQVVIDLNICSSSFFDLLGSLMIHPLLAIADSERVVTAGHSVRVVYSKANERKVNLQKSAQARVLGLIEHVKVL